VSENTILGIDLGTTNSAFAVLDEDGEPEIIINEQGDRTTPSVVAFDADDASKRLVGKPAKNQAVSNPSRTIDSIKRHMGDEYTVDIDDDEYTPEQISAMILQKIKHDAEEYLGEEVNDAVITVPAYFNDKQRQATKDAGEIAGFNVQRIVNEPTAAALAYGLDEDDTQTILVYDLGGGTFDVSVLDIGMGVYEVAATNGDNDLGGDDWDHAIIDWLVEQVKDEHGVDLEQDEQAMQRLSEAAEESKIELSIRKETTINLPFITADENNNPIHVEESLTRAKFEALTEELVNRTVEPTEQALDDAGYDKTDIDDVILVGGSTRMPMIQEKVKTLTEAKPKKDVNPDEVVSLGASVQGGVLGDAKDDIVLVDVTPLSLGVEVKGGLFERIIDKNTKIPVEESKTFTTASDNQTSVDIYVYQGEREMAEENELLGQFTLTGIPPAPAGTPRIDVQFKLDSDGIVNVTAHEKSSGTQKKITIEGGVGLSNDQIEDMKVEAQQHAEKDKERREKIEAKNDADDAIQNAKRILTENEVESGLKNEIQTRVTMVEDVIDEDAEIEEIQSVVNELNKKIREAGTYLIE